MAIARVDYSSALRASTFAVLSPQFCSVVLRSTCALSMFTSAAAGLQLPLARDLSAWRCSGARVYEAGVAGEERVRGMGGGGVGLLVLRMTDTGGACGRDVKRMLMAVVKRVAAVRAAATPEGFFKRGRREYDEGSYASAAQSWGRAVDLKHAHAHALLSMMLIDGRLDVPTDHIRAYELALAGAGMGCAHSKGVLGRCYCGGFGVAEDIAKAFELGRESAAAGSCMGQFLVGKCYETGLGVEQDDAEAVRWYMLAAELGHADAQCNLGAMFDEGEGVAQDRAEALRWYIVAAQQGDGHAQYNLGRMYRGGEGVGQDKAEAVRWYRLAAEQGDIDAQCCLGCMHREGEGIAQDFAQAAHFYRLAAEQGEADAQNILGLMFHAGEGVAQNRAEALRWFRLAAAQGDADSRFSIEALERMDA